MQKLLSLLLMVSSALAAVAQQAPPAPAQDTWYKVESLKVGAGVDVRTETQKLHCSITQVDDQGLACTSHKATITLTRAEIKTVTVRHLGRNTVLGLFIGVGAGAAIGAALPTGSGQIVSKGDVIAGGALGLGLIGTVIGATTGAFSHTIYRR